MESFLLVLTSGIMVGVIYGLLALGFVCIYKCSSVLNFAHGALVLLGAYIVWTLLKIGLPLWASIVLGLVISGTLGFFIDRFAIRPLLGQKLLIIVMATLALNEIIRGVVIMAWGSLDLAYTEALPQGLVKFGNISISQQHLIGALIAIILVIVFGLFFRYTRWGLAMKGVADSHQTTRSMGINVAAIIGISWAIAAMCAMLGGVLLGSIGGFHIRLWEAAIISIAAAFIGGLDSVPGTVVGGVIMGVIEKLITAYVGFAAGIPVAYIVLIVVMIFRPYGLWGQIKIERV